MIKRTITISSPSHLSLDRGQLVVYNKDKDQARTLPIEDIGYLLLENDRITLHYHSSGTVWSRMSG